MEPPWQLHCNRTTNTKMIDGRKRSDHSGRNLSKSVTFLDGPVCHGYAAHGTPVLVVARVEDEGL